MAALLDAMVRAMNFGPIYGRNVVPGTQIQHGGIANFIFNSALLSRNNKFIYLSQQVLEIRVL